MKMNQNWKAIAGWILHGLVGGIMILSGAANLLDLLPSEMVAKFNLSVPIKVIGAGELISGLLLLIPYTASLGVLLTSSFWGGAICLHIFNNEPFALPSILLLLTWIGAYLRVPGTFASFTES